jgi:hypothetical protein
MFGQSKNNKKRDEQDGIQKKSARGNMDEYEALRTIVAENPGLFSRVLEKIKIYRAMHASQDESGQQVPADKKKPKT